MIYAVIENEEEGLILRTGNIGAVPREGDYITDSRGIGHLVMRVEWQLRFASDKNLSAMDSVLWVKLVVE